MNVCTVSVSAMATFQQTNSSRVICFFVYQDVLKSIFQPFTIVLWAGISWTQEIADSHLYLFLPYPESFLRASGPPPKKEGGRLRQGRSEGSDFNWCFMSPWEVCVNSIAPVGQAWLGGKGTEEYILDEEMLHNLHKERVGVGDAAAQWFVYAYIVVFVYSLDFLDVYLSLCLDFPTMLMKC